jgi:deoxyribonuclease IV
MLLMLSFSAMAHNLSLTIEKSIVKIAPFSYNLVFKNFKNEKMKKTSADELLIGAHTSAAGGAYHALEKGVEIGATTIQFFSRNQRQWNAKPFSQEEIQNWKETLKKTGLKKIMVHDSYLINLGSPNKEALKKSQKAFHDELIRCQQLEVTYLNFHPGAALTSSEEECLDTIVESLLDLEKLADKGKTRLLIETTAGQGSSVGYRFEHLAYLVDRLHKKIPIGVCIDTCHIFAAGYDIRTKETWDITLKDFDDVVGLKHLYAFHLNDSMHPLGSRKDRHANLGKGKIGIDSFEYLMQCPKTRELPKYLETPHETLWKKEIELLREFAR